MGRNQKYTGLYGTQQMLLCVLVRFKETKAPNYSFTEGTGRFMNETLTVMPRSRLKANQDGVRRKAHPF